MTDKKIKYPIPNEFNTLEEVYHSDAYQESMRIFSEVFIEVVLTEKKYLMT
jgi:hypothetical protein